MSWAYNPKGDWKALVEAPSLAAADEYLTRYGSSTKRPEIVLNLLPVLVGCTGSREVWSWVVRQWSWFDCIPHGRFQRAFRRFRETWTPDCMQDTDRRLYNELPAISEVFRGQCITKPPGLSWTLQRSVAEGFAKGIEDFSTPSRSF